MSSLGNVLFPLAVLTAAGGAAVQIAIKFLILQGKAFPLLEKHEEDFIQKVDYAVTNEDKISQLPDDLLSGILLHLDLMEVVRLRILSRTWKNVCKLRGELRLDCLDMFRVNQSHDKCSRQDQFRFLKAVDNCLQLCSCQTITCLEISCCFLKRFTSDFIRWMQSIATLDIQKLHLRFLCSSSPLCEHVKSSTIDLFPFSFQLLSKAATLKHLHLCACVLQPRFTSQFNSLKSLYLDLVPMSNGELPRILSSCVNLQTLSVAYCKLSPKLCISGQCLQLKCLYVHSCPGLQEIVICAKNLNTFSCFAEGMMKFSLDVPNLEDARVHVRGPNAMPYMFGEVFKDCTKLKFLLFQIRTNEIRYVPTKMDMFSNLRTLSFVPIIETLADELEIAPILVACPLLEKLRLQFLCEGINQKRGEEIGRQSLLLV